VQRKEVLMFFAPYTPGEITFYGLLFGGYKLHKKFKKWDEECARERKERQVNREVKKWASKLKIRTLEDREKEVKKVDDALMNHEISVDVYCAQREILCEILLKLSDKQK
jgi:hypothetical protein